MRSLRLNPASVSPLTFFSSLRVLRFFRLLDSAQLSALFARLIGKTVDRRRTIPNHVFVPIDVHARDEPFYTLASTLRLSRMSRFIIISNDVDERILIKV